MSIINFGAPLIAHFIIYVVITDLYLQKTRLADLLYYCDNLAYFPYQVIDEPLFIIHHVDIVISVTGSNLLQSFKEVRYILWTICDIIELLLEF